MAGANQIPTQFLEIVDLTVEHYPDGFVFVRNGLVAGAQVDDAEPPHAQTAATVQMIALVIRTPVPDLIAHQADIGEFSLTLAQKLSGDATHKMSGCSDYRNSARPAR